MSARKVSKSLIEDIIAVAAHQTEELEFLQAALLIVHASAASGLASSGHPTFAHIQSLCDEALSSSMQGGDR